MRNAQFLTCVLMILAAPTAWAGEVINIPGKQVLTVREVGRRVGPCISDFAKDSYQKLMGKPLPTGPAYVHSTEFEKYWLPKVGRASPHYDVDQMVGTRREDVYSLGADRRGSNNEYRVRQYVALELGDDENLLTDDWYGMTGSHMDAWLSLDQGAVEVLYDEDPSEAYDENGNFVAYKIRLSRLRLSMPDDYQPSIRLRNERTGFLAAASLDLGSYVRCLMGALSK